MLDDTDRGDTQAIAAVLSAVLATGYQFVTPTPASHARVVARRGAGALARDLRDVLGWSLPFQDGVVPAPVLTALRDAGALEPVGDGWRSLIRVSTLNGMGFAHSAYPTVAADSVFFGPDTYRFAQAIAAALPGKPVERAVDIGCGAGPGAVLVARCRPKAEVFGVDINPAALRLARGNAAAAGVRVQAVESNLLDAVEGGFDLIVANPPYMADPGRRAYRDGGGPLGAALSLKILAVAMERLTPGGTLMLYTGAAIVEGQDPFLREAQAMLADTPFTWTYREMDPDVFGEELESGPYAAAERIAAVVLVATRQG